MSKRTIIFLLFLVASSGAFYFLNHNKIKQFTFCKDIRLYMDGGYYASVEKGGIRPKTYVSIFRRHNGKRVRINTVEVSSEAGTYRGPDVKLSVFNKPGTSNLLGKIEAKVGSELVTASLLCYHKTL